jgi:UDP-glucuronate decarboxylase
MDIDALHVPVNLGNPHEISARELAERIVSLTGSRLQSVHLPLPQDDLTQRCPDILFARVRLGWSPITPLNAVLGKTIAYSGGEGS